MAQEFSNILTTSKRSLVKIESDRGKEWYNSFFQNLLKVKNIHHFSRYTGKSPSIAEWVIRTIRKLLKKPVLLAGNADWLSELPSVFKRYNNTTHHLIKKTPNQASKKVNERKLYYNLNGKRKSKTKI